MTGQQSEVQPVTVPRWADRIGGAAGVVSPEIARVHESALRSINRVVTSSVLPTPPAAAAVRTAALLRGGGVVVLTGAGVSTDSGIPDYRGPQGSLRSGRPMTYQEFRHDPVALHRFWARSVIGWRKLHAVEPNRNHAAIARWVSSGQALGVITQNVDGLHQAAGTDPVVALHGDLATVVCLDCGHRQDRSFFDQQLEQLNPGYIERLSAMKLQVRPDGDVDIPAEEISNFRLAHCIACGSTAIKPDVVYFGEPVPNERKEQASALMRQAKALFVVGSSLAVMSGYRFAIDATRAGIPLVVINGGPCRADEKAEVVWRSDIGEALGDLEKLMDRSESQ